MIYSKKNLISQLPPIETNKSGWPWNTETPPAGNLYAQSLPEVSVVVPSFNQAPYIEETLRSLILQNYPSLQIIVMDGGSTDGSVDVIKKYAPWIDYWESTADRGQSHAINKGLNRATGAWFNWLNSDDRLEPGALFHLAMAAKSSTANIVYGSTQNFDANGSGTTYRARIPGHELESLFNVGVNQPGSLLRREVVQQLGGVREELNLTMDLDLWLRLILEQGSNRTIGIPEIVAAYRYHEQSKTCSGEDVFAAEEFAILFDLAESGGVALNESLKSLRIKTGVSPATFPIPEDIDPSIWAKAFADRLVVNDSLLLRALKLTGTHQPLAELNRLVPEVVAMSLPDGKKEGQRRESEALLHGLQIEGRFSLLIGASILRRSPRWANWRALAALVYHNARGAPPRRSNP